MKKLLILGTSLAVLLSAGVVMAGDDKSTDANNTVLFQSLSSVPSNLTPMTDDALEATEGKGNLCGAFCGTLQLQSAKVRQRNVSIASLLAFQTNTALIVQSNSN